MLFPRPPQQQQPHHKALWHRTVFIGRGLEWEDLAHGFEVGRVE